MKTIPMEAAIKVVRHHAEVAIRHYRAVNENTKFSPNKARQDECRSAGYLLIALTGETPTREDVDKAVDDI